MTPSELLKLMENQSDHQPTITIDAHKEFISRQAELETELVSVNRHLEICRKNIQHYESSAASMLQTRPEAFGQQIVDLLLNIAKAKVLNDHPELFEQLSQLQSRKAEIESEVNK